METSNRSPRLCLKAYDSAGQLLIRSRRRCFCVCQRSPLDLGKSNCWPLVKEYPYLRSRFGRSTGARAPNSRGWEAPNEVLHGLAKKAHLNRTDSDGWCLGHVRPFWRYVMLPKVAGTGAILTSMNWGSMSVLLSLDLPAGLCGKPIPRFASECPR